MKRVVLVLTIVAASVRLGFVLATSHEVRDEKDVERLFPDEQEHLDLGDSVAHGEGFVTWDGRLFARGPLYPLFCAAHIALFRGSTMPMRYTQALLGSLAVPLTFLLARRVASPNASFLAALYVAFDPFLVYFSKLLLVEELYAPLLAAQLLLLLRIQATQGLIPAALLGLLAALATLLHPGHLALMGALVVFLPLVQPKEVARMRRVALLAVYVAVCVAVMSPWVMRNESLSGKLLPVTAKLGRDLFESIGPGADGGPATQKVKWPKDLPKGEIERDDALRKEDLRILRTEPGRVLGLVPSKFIRFWNVVPNYGLSRRAGYVVVSTLAYLPLFALALLGAWVLLRKDLRAGLLWLLFPALLCALHLVFVGSVRYRIPLHPILPAIAAVGLDRLVWRRATPS